MVFRVQCNCCSLQVEIVLNGQKIVTDLEHEMEN